MSATGKSTLYQGGAVARESSKRLAKEDVLVTGGTITKVGKGLRKPRGAEVVDCRGLILMPAMFDAHVHAREPGQEAKENIATCTRAAVNGGVTGIVLMPNTTPAIDSAGLVQSVLDIAAKSSPIPVFTTGCITKGRAGRDLAGIAGMKDRGVFMLTDDGDPVPDPQVLRRAMEYAEGLGMMLASHCETPELSGKGAMNEGPASYRLGIPGIPAASEELCIDRDCRLAQLTGAKLHIQHVTSLRGVQTIARYKAEGVRVTCEVSPHHLIFNEEDIGDYDTNYKMNPPLRTPADNEGLLQALIDGDFDLIATDHAPHTSFEKQQDFVSAPFGITGLETAVVSLFHHFINPGTFGWDLLVKRYSAEPRRLMGLEPAEIAENKPADFLLFDPKGSTAFTAEFMESKSTNTPFINQCLDGQIRRVVLGRKVLLDR